MARYQSVSTRARNDTWSKVSHYDDVIMATMSSQITPAPAQMASNAENVSIWWRHHVYPLLILAMFFQNFLLTL